MSDDESSAQATAARNASQQPLEARPRYKSWRKKYRKMRVRFDETMKLNSSMFKEEQKLEALSMRLQEQNDQILDLLLDLNSSFLVPEDQRYNVKYREDWADREGLDFDRANVMLANYYEREQQGRVSQAELRQLKTGLEEHLAVRNAETLEQLERRVPHPVYSDKGVAELDLTSLLTSAHEDDYLTRIDAKLGNLLTGTAEVPAPSWAEMSNREIEREVELRNPLSVHNWLKKHVAGDGNDRELEGDAVSGKKNLLRTTMKKGKLDSPGADQMDDELGLDDVPAKGRKSRGADDSYKPRGRGGGMRGKRKRDDAEGGVSGKKARLSMQEAGEA